jgi:hypothetical protein
MTMMIRNHYQFLVNITAGVLLTLLAAVTPAPAAPPQYTIAQLYSAARRAPEIKGAKSFAEHAVITSASYRVDRDNLLRYYFHPEYGRQIKELLEKDTFASYWQIDAFLRRNRGRLHHVSLYPEGFILVQLDNPQQVLIIPVSLVTVRKSEEIVKTHLTLQ